LKSWVAEGRFFLTIPVLPLPGIEAGIKMNTLEERMPSK